MAAAINDCAVGYPSSERNRTTLSALIAATSVATWGPNMSNATKVRTKEGAMMVRSLAAEASTLRNALRAAARVSAKSSTVRSARGQPASCGRKTVAAEIAARAATPGGKGSFRMITQPGVAHVDPRAREEQRGHQSVIAG